MKATIENLELNKAEIQQQLIDMFGIENLNSSFNMLSDLVEFNSMNQESENTISDLMSEIANSEIFMHKSSSKMAELQGDYMELTNLKYNHNTRTYENN